MSLPMLQIDERFKDRVRSRLGGYDFEVGILENKKHFPPLPKGKGFSSLYGRQVRKMNKLSTRKPRKPTAKKPVKKPDLRTFTAKQKIAYKKKVKAKLVKDKLKAKLKAKAKKLALKRAKPSTLLKISKLFRKNTEINIYKEPFRHPYSKDYKKFRAELVGFLLKTGGRKGRLLKLFRAMVTNPVMQKRYGKNAKSTIQTKGFDWLGVDTGQLLKGVKARIQVRRKR